MPNYPKYDPEKRVEIAIQLKNVINAVRIDGDTETGRLISNWAPEGNWLDKAIEYFTPTEEEHKDREMLTSKNSIRDSLEKLKKTMERLDRFVGGMEPENAEEEWERLMFDIDSCSGLSNRLMKFNEHTGFKKLNDPGMQAAFGVGSMLTRLNSKLDLIGRDYYMERFRNHYEEDAQRKRDMIEPLYRHVANCKAANVDYSYTDQFLDIVRTGIESVREKREKYEGLSKLLEAESDKEEIKQHTESAEIVATRMELAYLQYKLCGQLASNKEPILNTELLNLEMDRNGGASTPEQEKSVKNLQEELKKLTDIRDREKKEYNRLKTHFETLDPDIQRAYNTEFKFNTATASERITRLTSKLEAWKAEYAKENPESVLVSDSGKKLSEDAKHMAEQLKEKENVLNEKFYKPIENMKITSLELSAKLKSFNSITTELKGKAHDFQNETPVNTARNRMKDFLEQLDMNKRRFHRDSPEFTALKDKVRRFSESDKTVRLSDIKNAAKTYLDKIEGQRFSLNTTQRNYRKNLVGMIMDYSDYANGKREFLKTNGKEINNHVTELEKIKNEVDGRNVDYYSCVPIKLSERNAMKATLEDNMKNVTKELTGPVENLDSRIQQHISMTNKLKAPEAPGNNLRRQPNQPAKESPSLGMR